MGWGRYLLLGDLGQQLDLQDHRKEISRMRRRLHERRLSAARGKGERRKELAALEAEVDELRLFLAVLVRAVVAKGVLTEEEFRSLVAAVDAEDGAADGKFEGPVV